MRVTYSKQTPEGIEEVHGRMSIPANPRSTTDRQVEDAIQQHPHRTAVIFVIV